jgi:hypothetical protein
MDPWSLADALFNGSLHQSQLGAPFVVVRWQAGQLQIANDMLGLVRLFHYRFDDADVWSTRQGLAHIFTGNEPKRNPLAWAGMAAMGWAIGGETQLGSGKQLIGGTYLRAGHNQDGRFLEERNLFGEWLESTRSGPMPSTARNAQDMELLMSSAKRWPTKAIADLSGGKDSRVCAALGIRSGAVSAVQTINSDRGDVETAKRLMEAIDTDVSHIIIEKQARVVPGGHFSDRVASQHTAFEGRYLAAAAVNARTFSKFRSVAQAKFNGLGGEVLGGGNFATGLWRAKMIGAPAEAAAPRLAAMVNSNRAASNQAKELVVEQMESFLELSKRSGATTAGEVLDMLYSRDRMPNWSATFATSDVLCPLFAPSTLAISAHTMGAPVEDGDWHRELLRLTIPAWADVPFYKPTTKKTRSTPYIWEDPDWRDVESFIRQRIDGAEAFDRDGVMKTLDSIEAGEPGKSEEVVVFRFLWDQTFDDYADQVAARARSVREEVAAVTGGNSSQMRRAEG